MKLPKYNSNKTYKQLIKKVKKRGRDYSEEDDFDGLENHIVNFALEYLNLNLKYEVYIVLYDYLKYNDPTAETSKFQEIKLWLPIIKTLGWQNTT